jgi:hypothetical protein
MDWIAANHNTVNNILRRRLNLFLTPSTLHSFFVMGHHCLNNAHIYYAIIKVQINKQLLVLLHFLI